MKETKESTFQDPFLEGNELIEKAIGAYHAAPSKENLNQILEAIRTRMHADGHLIFPVIMSEDGSQFAFRSIQTKDGKNWLVGFTSHAEFQKGQPSQLIANFIDATLKKVKESGGEGLVLNPWGQPFFLGKELIDAIFAADGDTEYVVPEDKITPELLEDGSFLKRAVEICARNRTQLNMFKLMRILRDSQVWIPCNMIMSDADQAVLEKLVKEAQESGGLDTLVGKTLTNQDNIRMVPDILQNSEGFFFPVFTTAEEMGEYGNHFSKVQEHFLRAIVMARNNEKKVLGIVINAFSTPFVLPCELFDMVEGMDSNFKKEA